MHSILDATEQNHRFSPKDKWQVPHPLQDAISFCPQCVSDSPEGTCFVTPGKCRAAMQEGVALRGHGKCSGPPYHPVTTHAAEASSQCLPGLFPAVMVQAAQLWSLISQVHIHSHNLGPLTEDSASGCLVTNPELMKTKHRLGHH